MATTRYRIHFVASFEHEVVAETAQEARRIAVEISAQPVEAVRTAEKLRCSWNYIKPAVDESVDAE